MAFKTAPYYGNETASKLSEGKMLGTHAQTGVGYRLTLTAGYSRKIGTFGSSFQRIISYIQYNNLIKFNIHSKLQLSTYTSVMADW